MSSSSSVVLLIVLTATCAIPAESSAARCINITITNVLDIGECLGSNADFCSSPSAPITDALVKIVGCAFKGVLEYGSPEGVLNALFGLGAILLNSLGLGYVLNNIAQSSDGHLLKTENTCGDPLVINLPPTGVIGKCVDDLVVTCQNGHLAEDTTVVEVMETLQCVLKKLSNQDLDKVAKGVLRDLVNLLMEVNIGGPFKLTANGRIRKD
ncbi:uncharacterized protein LOC144158870 isoform X3 [Haemaphysalis longicornis]